MDILAGKGFYAPYGGKTAVRNDGEMTYYVRGEAWDGVTEAVWGEGVITGQVSVEKMHAWRKAHPNAFIAALADSHPMEVDYSAIKLGYINLGG